MPLLRDVNWRMSSSNSHSVQAFWKAVFDFSGRVLPYSKALGFSDGCDIEVYRSASPIIPLFPRKPPTGYSKGAGAKAGNRLNSFAELSVRLSTIPTEGLERDLFNEDMRVIDGWGMYMRGSTTT